MAVKLRTDVWNDARDRVAYMQPKATLVGPGNRRNIWRSTDDRQFVTVGWENDDDGVLIHWVVQVNGAGRGWLFAAIVRRGALLQNGRLAVDLCTLDDNGDHFGLNRPFGRGQLDQWFLF